MKLSLLVVAVVVVVPSLALADDASVSIVVGKFGDHIEQGQPTGDAKTIATARKAVYWFDAANTGDPAQVTLVWTIDGTEVQRQSLEVGHSPHWRTWGARPISGAHKIDVQVLDASGKSLKEDSVTLEG